MQCLANNVKTICIAPLPRFSHDQRDREFGYEVTYKYIRRGHSGATKVSIPMDAQTTLPNGILTFVAHCGGVMSDDVINTPYSTLC